MNVIRSMILACVAVATLASCVTTTTGGFNTTPSQERAERDLVQLAIGYFDAGDMAGARRNINNALAINSRSSDAYNVLALILQREGDVELARQTFERALSYDSRNSRARNNFAAFLFDAGDYEQSYRQLEIVANDTTYESRALAFENLGLSALRTARPERAEYAFDRALQLNRNLYRSSMEMAQIKFEKGEFAESMNYYNQFVTSSNFYNVVQTPRSLWLGIQLERRFDNEEGAAIYAVLLERLYRDSLQYQQYLNSQNEQ
ncbi:MAG: type IV pilus biogenesis/stability protein PilW [Gammaproteobacteria bacterium]|nr:type IV pilus biogenesis/stability protein PilW [Gammaproteobacteria bacterium]MDP2140624.1 type IV pilus biogenesis/stability protein PilW [Gammaproteobacteria bacterium]MDP2347396.1 type IV pilus biogenesis/stability protein PilW [Gammaproteobacteria bacterium]